MARTGMFFQAARGRAMVRRNAMQLARFWQRVAALDDVHEIRYQLRRKSSWGKTEDTYLYTCTLDKLRQFVETLKVREVNRARRANREWREYRALAKQLGELG